jgi:hypothetical protein
VARQRPPDFLPEIVLARPDFMRACAERDLGSMLRIAKQWGGAGFSSSHLARRCELTVSRVQDYVSGRVQARSIEIFERVADGLHIPGALLDLAPRAWESTVVAVTAQTSTTDGDSSVLRQTELEIMAGRCWAELRRPIRAIPALESAMSRYGDSHARDKALYLSWLADSYLDAGEVEHAAVTLGRSFDLAENVGSSRTGQRLNSVLSRFQPHGSVGEVGELLARRPLHPVQVGS